MEEAGEREATKEAAPESAAGNCRGPPRMDHGAVVLRPVHKAPRAWSAAWDRPAAPSSFVLGLEARGQLAAWLPGAEIILMRADTDDRVFVLPYRPYISLSGVWRRAAPGPARRGYDAGWGPGGESLPTV